MPSTARSLLCQGGLLEYHTTPCSNSPCPPSLAAAHIFGKETGIRECTWVKGKSQVLDLAAQRAELWAATGSVPCRQHSLLS